MDERSGAERAFVLLVLRIGDEWINDNISQNKFLGFFHVSCRVFTIIQPIHKDMDTYSIKLITYVLIKVFTGAKGLHTGVHKRIHNSRRHFALRLERSIHIFI